MEGGKVVVNDISVRDAGNFIDNRFVENAISIGVISVIRGTVTVLQNFLGDLEIKRHEMGICLRDRKFYRKQSCRKPNFNGGRPRTFGL